MGYRTLMRKCVQSALFAVVLPMAGAFAGSPAEAPGQRLELAYLTVKPGLSVDQSSKDAVTNACGALGTAAKSPEGPTAINAQIVGGWGGDQYSSQTDTKANKKYGNHVTVETYDACQRFPADRALARLRERSGLGGQNRHRDKQ